MKTRYIIKTLALSSAAMIAMMATPAQAQNTCDVDGTDGGNNAADANAGATATGTDSLACGENANASAAGGVAIGTGATVSGPSAINPLFAPVAVGYNTVAVDNAVAIGNQTVARFSGTVTPPNVGANSAVGIGAYAVAVGSNTVAIGTTSRAGTGFSNSRI